MFECFAFKHVPKELITKLDLKAQHIMVFVGYAKNSKVVSYGTQEGGKLLLPQMWTSMRMHQQGSMNVIREF
jgi:hypothetical protein